MCRPNGCLVDDLLVYQLGVDHYLLVVNGANIEKDLAWAQENAAQFSNVTVVDQSDEINLLAVQGPQSLNTLQPLTNVNLSEIAFYTFVEGSIAGVPAIISRTGYTGELGFELYFRADVPLAEEVAQAVFNAGEQFGIGWVGLGARDTLRLEKGYCLYGNDIDESTNPIEGGLGWITKLKKGPFNGAEAIAAVKEQGATRKLVGFVIRTEKLLPRQHYPILVGGEQVGEVTSGGMSPGLGTGIGMGYVPAALAEPGTLIEIGARNTTFPAEVVKVPFL
jgi:aminomethyltransferase